MHLCGTKITFEKEDVYIKIKNDEVWSTCSNIGFELDDEDINMKDIVKIEEPIYNVVYEAKADVLDEKEKEYLSNVIRPFKRRVDYIYKHRNSDERYEHIVISLDGEEDEISFPTFEQNTIYKGMEVDREYSLEELGL